ncbi:protein O-mannosyl-transferase TMTC1 isoform 2-T2 [Pholidichthys leucotaenia]
MEARKGPPLRRLRAAGRYAALAAVCALCYGNSLHGELVHDDVWAIVNNPDVRPGSSLRNIFSDDFWGKRMADNTSHKSYRPLCVLTFKLNILLGGLTPFYFHVVNVCLHCLVTCLLMCTCECCVFENPRLAFVTALLFAVHPVHTEAVSGIVGRADVLACLLFLLTFLSYTRSVGRCISKDSLPYTVSPLAMLVSLFLGTCAMLVKETGITVFGVCLLYDALVLCRKPLIYHLSGSRRLDLLHICSPFIKRASLISGYVALIMSVRLWLMGGSMPLFSEQDNPASFSPHLLTRSLTYSYLLSFNAWLLLAPVTLCYDWQVGSIPVVESLDDPRNVATALLALVMLALCVHCIFSLQMQHSQEVLVGMLFLVFPFIPATNLFFRVGFVVAERVLYMPSMGYCILVAHGLGRLCAVVGRWGTTVLSLSVLMLLLLFSWKTVQQNTVWVSREALFRSGIQTLPHNAKVHYNYANYLKDTGRHQEAIHHYNIALRLCPRHASAMNNLGTLTHSPEEAELFYRKALDINPQHNRALFNLGNLLRALRVTRKVDILGPLGALYYNTGRYEEALQVYREAVTLQPDSTDIWLALAQVLVMAGDAREAEKMTLEIISREGSCIECYRLLSAIYSKRGNYSEALEALDQALQQNPSDLTVRAELYFSRGNQLREMSQLDRAFESYRLAVELKPDQPQAWMNMGGIKHIKGDYAAARMYYTRALLLSPGSKLLKENLAKLDRLERRLTRGK